MGPDHDAMRERLLEAFDMFEFGVEMMAATLRRRHPDASAERIEALLEDWLAGPPAPPARLAR